MKKNMIIGLLFLLVLTLSACSAGIIRLNGGSDITIEVNSVYEEKGVKMPKDCSYMVDGEVDTSRIGFYILTYYVYSENGEVVSTLHRYVKVDDTTPPTYELKLAEYYHLNREYRLSDFAKVTDNYCDAYNIHYTPNTITFTEKGMQKVEFLIKDAFGNSVVLKCDVLVVENPSGSSR